MKRYPESIHVLYDWLTAWRHVGLGPGHRLAGRAEIRPFFIIGSGRSGNTLLRRILQAHGDLHIPPETYALGTTIKKFRQYRHMKWPDLVRFTLSQFEFEKEFETFGMSLRQLANEATKWPPAERNLAHLLDAIYRRHAQKSGQHCLRWGDKTPLNTFYLERIISVFPTAQFIHIIRDGADVASSFLEAGLFTAIEDAGDRWLTAVTLAQAFGRQHESLYAEIRYEDLVTAPAEQVLRLTTFLGVEFRQRMLASESVAGAMGDVAARPHHANVGKPITGARIGKGRGSLTPAQRQQLQPIIGELLESLGYQPVGDTTLTRSR